MRYYVNSVLTLDFINEKVLLQLREETKKDDTMKTLYKTILDGWPDDQRQVQRSIQQYFKFRHELTLHEGIIIKNNRILVPPSMRKDIKKRLHSGHLGIVKTKSVSRDSVYWPGIDADIEDMINSCESCQEFQNKLKKESELKHKIPSTPWTKVATDLFELDDKDYLLVVDYTTNYYDISLLPNKKSSTVVLHTKRIFSKFGIPKTVMSDNGPEYVGKAYANFSREWDFEHDTSSPQYPQSNGLVERTIQRVKKTLKKAFRDNQDPYLALLATKVSSGPYNNAPPATLMFHRPIR